MKSPSFCDFKVIKLNSLMTLVLDGPTDILDSTSEMTE